MWLHQNLLSNEIYGVVYTHSSWLIFLLEVWVIEVKFTLILNTLILFTILHQLLCDITDE